VSEGACLFEWRRSTSLQHERRADDIKILTVLSWSLATNLSLFHWCFMLYTWLVTQTVPVQLRHQWHRQNQSRNLCPNAGCVCVCACDTSVVLVHWGGALLPQSYSPLTSQTPLAPPLVISIRSTDLFTPALDHSSFKCTRLFETWMNLQKRSRQICCV